MPCRMTVRVGCAHAPDHRRRGHSRKVPCKLHRSRCGRPTALEIALLPQLVRRGARSRRTIDPANGPSGSPSRRSRDLGQAVVEFALILPIFILLLLMAVDFGRLFFTYIQLNNTAREAVAYAAFNPTTDNATLTTVARGEANVQAQRGEGPMTATSSCVDSAGTPLACSLPRAAPAPVTASPSTSSDVHLLHAVDRQLLGRWPACGASATAAVVDYAAGGGGAPPTCSTPAADSDVHLAEPEPVHQPLPHLGRRRASTNSASPCQNIGYNWDFGGRAPPGGDYLREGDHQDYEYVGPGTYTVTLVVSNAAGDSPPYPTTINLGTTTCNGTDGDVHGVAGRDPSRTGTSRTGSAANNGGNNGTQFTFDGSTSAFMSDPACHPTWSWNLGDGTTYLPPTANATPPSSYLRHSWVGATVHVTLTVTNDAGTDSSDLRHPVELTDEASWTLQDIRTGHGRVRARPAGVPAPPVRADRRRPVSCT